MDSDSATELHLAQFRWTGDKGVVTTYCSHAGTETRLAHVTQINWRLIDFMLSDSCPQGCFDSLGLLGKNRA